MLQNKVIFIFLLLISGVSVYAQQKISKLQFIADSTRIVKPKLVRPQFKFDNRLTFLNGQKLSISGLDAGVLLKNKLRLTLGYYSVTDKLTSLKKTFNEVEYQGQYNLNYAALNLEFIYINTRFFSLGMPLEFGFGNNTLSYKSEAYNLQTEKESGFISLAYFALSGTFKPFRWIGLKMAFGYRNTLYNQIENLAFDGIYTSVGLSFDFREILVDCRMFKLKKRYYKNANAVETAVDLIMD